VTLKLTLSALIKAAAAKIGKPHPAEEYGKLHKYGKSEGK
jgi:hypothetical protein